MNRLSSYETSPRSLAIALLTFFMVATPARAQTVSANHGQLEFLLGVPTFTASTGWIGGNIAGFGVYIEAGGGIGGTLEQITMNGNGVLTHVADTAWSLGFQGTTGNANTYIGLTARAQYKLVVPSSTGFGGTYQGDIFSIGMAFSDSKNFTPYLFNSSVTLTSTLPDLPTIYRNFYVPGTKKYLSIDAGLTLGTSLENEISADHISTSAGDLTPDAPTRPVNVTSTPYAVSNIRAHLKSNVTIYITPKATVGFTVWVASYSMTIPIVRIPSKIPEQTYQTSSSTATFNMPSVQLSVAKTGTGNGQLQVNGSPKTLPFGPQTYTYGTSVSLVPLPANGSSFTGWTGILPAGGQKQNPLTFSLGANRSLSADFTPTTSASESLTIRLVSPFLGGTIKVNGVSQSLSGSRPYGGRFKVGDKVRFEYVEGTNDKFQQWYFTEPPATSFANPLVVTIAPTQYGHQFVNLTVYRPEYKLSIAKTGTGTGKMYYIINNLIKSSPVPFDTTIASGQSVRLQIASDAGSIFTGWGGDLKGTSVIKDIVMTKDLNVSVGLKLDTRYYIMFKVNMGVYIHPDVFGFDPVNDSVVVRGDFQHFLGSTDWQGNEFVMAKSPVNDSLFTKMPSFPDSIVGKTINYKFVIVRNGEEIWESGISNRAYTANTNPFQYLPSSNRYSYFDDQTSTHVVNVAFTADLSTLIAQGFDPDNHFIGISGSVRPLSWSTRALLHQDSMNPNLYRVSVPVVGPAGIPIEWKFRGYPDSLFVNSGWDMTASNRVINVPAADTALGPITPSIQLLNPTGVREVYADEVPTSVRLEQNYPNPFNPTTTISYTIPHDTYVSLKVYDTRGEQVVELVKGNQHAGSYSASFDASQLPSGVYLYRLQAGRSTETKKMVLVK